MGVWKRIWKALVGGLRHEVKKFAAEVVAGLASAIADGKLTKPEARELFVSFMVHVKGLKESSARVLLEHLVQAGKLGADSLAELVDTEDDPD